MTMSNDTASGKMQNNVPLYNNFRIGRLFDNSWDQVKGAKGSIWGAFIIYLIIQILLSLLTSKPHDPTTTMYLSIISLIGSLVFFPLMPGLYYLGVRRSANLPLKVRMIFNPYNRFFHLLGTLFSSLISWIIVASIGGGIIYLSRMIPMTIVSYIGIALGVIIVAFSIFLLVGFLLFAPMLVFEKKMGVFAAMGASLTGFTRHFLKLVICFFVLGILMDLSIIPIFIGLIWTIPLAVIVYGNIYRSIFGVMED